MDEKNEDHILNKIFITKLLEVNNYLLKNMHNSLCIILRKKI
jgi:hypothetical protein